MGEIGHVPSMAGVNCPLCYVASVFRKSAGETLYVEYQSRIIPF